MASQMMKEQLKKPKRNLGFLRVTFNIIDPDANPSVSANNEETFSDLQKIKEPYILQTKNYATLEKNFWLLDDSQPLLGSEELQQTYISSFMSNENCTFSENASFTITNEIYLTTLGLTMTFDNINNNYVKKLNVKAYRDETKIMDKDYILSDYKEKIIFADNDELVKWNKIVITFLETSLPYRRVRISQLLFGIKEVYTDENIISAESKEKTTMINSELPSHTFKFTIDNMDKKFNMDNPDGYYRYLLQRQPISYEWGYQLDNGTIEYVLGGHMLLTGNAEVKNNQVSFNTTTLINYLTNIYKKGVYSSTGESLYDLAVKILTFSGITSDKYNISDTLKTIKTNAPLPKLEVRQLLQIIATAGNCTLFTTRENIINIQPLNFNVVSSDSMDYGFMESRPTIKLQAELAKSIVYINHYLVESSTSELFKNDNLIINGTITVEVEYDLATEITGNITNATIDSAEYYGRYAILTLTNSNENPCTLIINGKKINVSQTIDTKIYKDDGENIEYKNELVTQMSESTKEVKLKEFIGNWYSNRNIYSFSNRGDILKDTREIIPIETDFSNSINGYLVENNINYNGAWKGNSTVIKVGDNSVD